MEEINSRFFLPVAYALFFAVAICLSFLINGLLLKFSRTLGNRQIQHRHTIRWSNNVKPSVGGFSFYIVFLFSVSIFSILNFSDQEYLNKHLLGIVAAVTTGFLLGLADDAYDTIPLLKFFSQLCCGLFLVVTDTIIPATGIYIFDALVTLIWVVGIMNSINMLDNMDGISGIVSFFIMLACFLVLVLEHETFSIYSLMLIGVSGGVAGFLYFNWHPARVYMGDTGSQFLGAFISAISIPILWKYHESSGDTIQPRQYLIPLIAFTVPIIDTATVFIRRIARRHSPFIGGRDHITHHFAYAGLKDKQVIYLLGGWALLSAGLTVVLVAYKEQLNNMMISICYSYFCVMFIVVQFIYDRGLWKAKEHPKHAATEKPEMKSGPATQSVSA